MPKLPPRPKAQPSQPPAAEPSPPESNDQPSFLLMGEDAVMAIASRGIKRAGAFYTHDRPGDVDFNVNGDMTAMASAQVSRAFQFFTGMHAFLACELGKLDAEQIVLEFQLRVIKQTIILEHADEKGKKKYDVDAKVTLNEQHLRLATALAEKGAYRAALEASTKGLENKAACLSREMTRRCEEVRLNQRAGH